VVNDPSRVQRLISLVILCVGATITEAQVDLPKAVDVAKEPHHKLLLENASTRVFRLALAKGESTQGHQHGRPYVFIALVPSMLSNEVPGRRPIISNLEYGELRSSKGGFSLTERNAGAEPADLVVIELKTHSHPSGGFATPEADYHYHNVMIGHLFETDDWRGYEINISSEGNVEKHKENCDRLIIAVSEAHLRNDVESKATSNLDLNPGEVTWFPAGDTISTVNVGSQPAKLIILEFR